MGLKTCKIDVHEMLFWQGQPPPLTLQEIVMDERAGVDGTELTRIGTRGKPFQLVSQVDCRDIDDCYATYDTYKDLIDGDPVELIWYDVNSTTYDYKVQVLAVVPSKIQTIKSAIGGKNPPSEGFLECVWSLIQIPI